MEQRIRPHTTLTIVPRQGFAKRSGMAGGPPSFPSPRPRQQAPPQKVQVTITRPGGSRGPRPTRPPVGVTPPHRTRLITPITKSPVTTPLESMYLITVNKAENSVSITLPPGREGLHTADMSTSILSILTERGVYQKGIRALIVKSSKLLYDKNCIGGATFNWVNPLTKKKTVFVVKHALTQSKFLSSQGQNYTKTTSPSISKQGVSLSKPVQRNPLGRPRKVEVIDLDSEDDDKDDDKVKQKPLTKAKAPIIQRTYANSISTNAQSTINSRRLSENSVQKSQQKLLKGSSPELEPKELHVSVVRGNSCGLPSKTIVASSKSISCLYKIPDIKKFREKQGNSLKFAVHPFLGEKFVVVTGPFSNSVKDENKCPLKNKKIVPLPPTHKRKINEESKKADLSKKPKIDVLSDDNNDSDSLVGSRSLRSRRQPLATKSVESTTKRTSINTTTKKNTTQIPAANTSNRRIRQISFSSSSDNSDDNSSSTDSDSSSSDNDEDEEKQHVSSDSRDSDAGERLRRSRRATATVANKRNQRPSKPIIKPEVIKPPPKCFAESKPCRPIRKSSDGRIYFSLKARVAPNEYYKNEDLFVNWEKFVRTESEVTQYYKTAFLRNAQCSLIIYRMERQMDKLVVDRSVELVTDGTIKVILQGEDVTQLFMQYVNIETNTHLNSLLTNLINSRICPGCPDFSIISAYPEGIFRDDVWYSTKCSRVVFNEKDSFVTSGNPTPMNHYSYLLRELCCPPCIQLRKHLELEKAAIFKMNNNFKIKVEAQTNKRKSRAKAQQIIYGKYKPPSIEKMQIREALSDLFLDFFKELGFKEEEFPKQKVDLSVSVVTEKDFPIIAEEELQDGSKIDPNPIPGLPPPLPDSIPILENIDFDENGQTLLTFSEIPLNPYEIQNIHFMNPNMSMPEFSNEMIDSLMNSDPEAIIKTLIDADVSASTPSTASNSQPGPLLGGTSQCQTPKEIENSNSCPSHNNNLSGNLNSSPNSNFSHTPSTHIHQDSISIPVSSGRGQQQYQPQPTYEYQHQQYTQQQYEEYHQIPPEMQNFNNPNLNASVTANSDGYPPNASYQYPNQSYQNNNLDQFLNDSENSLIFPTFSLTEL